MQPSFGQVVAMKQKPGHGHRTAGIGGQKPHGLADLELAYRYDVVHVLADVFKIDGSDTLTAQAIRDGAGGLLGGRFGNLSGAEAGLGISRELGLDSDDLDGRFAEFDGGGDAADHAPTADRDENRLDDGQIFENFQTDGTLASDDFLVVKGRNDRIALALG